MKSKLRVKVSIASFHFQTLTTELVINQSTPSLWLPLNIEHRLLSHRDLMRLVATVPSEDTR